MVWTSILYMASCAVIVVVLLFTSVSDIRSREIADSYWMLIGIVGIVSNFLCSIPNGGAEVLFGAIGEILFLIAILVDQGKRDLAFFAGSAVMTVISLFCGGLSPSTIRCTLPVVFGTVFLGFYWLGIIRGGADTKCLIVSSMALPVYPGWVLLDGVPGIVNILFAPSVAMMFLASLMSVVGSMVYCFVRNVGNRELRINGFYLSVGDVEHRFVWPMEDIVDGKIVRCQIPEDESISEVCTRLEDAGVVEVLVTPMIPFLVPLTVSFLVVTVFGSPFTLLC